MASARLWLVTAVGAAAGCADPALADEVPAYTPTCDYKSSFPLIDESHPLRAFYPVREPVIIWTKPKKTKVSAPPFRIPAGLHGYALARFVCDTGKELTFPARWGAGQSSSLGVEGQLPVRQALERLLVGTGLSIALENAKGFVLARTDAAPALAEARPPDGDAAPGQPGAISFDVPAGDLSNALRIFGRQSAASQLSVPAEEVAGLQTAGLRGQMLPRQALERLLGGTGLTFLQDESGAYFIRRSNSVRTPGGRCVRDEVSPSICREQ